MIKSKSSTVRGRGGCIAAPLFLESPCGPQSPGPVARCRSNTGLYRWLELGSRGPSEHGTRSETLNKGPFLLYTIGKIGKQVGAFQGGWFIVTSADWLRRVRVLLHRSLGMVSVGVGAA